MSLMKPDLVLFSVNLTSNTEIIGYLDPGTITYVLSLIVGTIVVTLTYIKAIMSKIKQQVKNFKSRKKDSNKTH